MNQVLDYSHDEWQLFTKQEKRIILMLRLHNMEPEQVRENMTWPLSPMNERTFSNHVSRMMKKISAIRYHRNVQPSVLPELNE